MSRIATCPACHGEITIPATAQIAEQLRCPLCQAQFDVASVLAGSVEGPPEALRVEPPLPNVTAAVGPSLSRVEDLSHVQVRAAVSAARPKPRGPSFFGQLLGIVLGGAVGLALGYIVLLRFGGPQYDFLKVAGMLPPWMLPPAQQAVGGDGEGGADPETAGRSLSDLLDQPDPPPQSTPPIADPQSADPIAAPPLDPSPVPNTAPQSGDENPPNTAAVPPQRVGPRTHPNFTADELSAALAEAAALIGCEHCNSRGVIKRTVVTGVREVNGKKIEQKAEREMPCDVCRGTPIPKITPEVYQKLSRLAEAVTFPASESAASDAWRRRDTVVSLLRRATSEPQRAETIGRLAGFQLDAPAREHGGIALAGTVQEIAAEGRLYLTRLVLFGLGKPVTVVSWRPPQPAFQAGDRVLILGSIVENPAENLLGYEGSLPLVVWGGLPVKLPAAQR